MADEPDRRLVGAMVAELEAQVKENPFGAAVSVDGMGLCWVDGPIDLYLLADAIRKHLREET